MKTLRCALKTTASRISGLRRGRPAWVPPPGSCHTGRSIPPGVAADRAAGPVQERTLLLNTVLSVVVGFLKERTLLLNAVLSVIVGLAVSASVVAGVTGGILGDVDDNGRVDMMDGMWVNLHSVGLLTSFPKGDIALGDVNADGRIDSTDVRLIAAYIVNPSDPALPPGIGQPLGMEKVVCSVGLELSPGTSCTVDLPKVKGSSNWKEYSRFKVKADGTGYYTRFKVLGPGLGVSRIRDLKSSSRIDSDIDSDEFRASPIAGTSKWRINALP